MFNYLYIFHKFNPVLLGNKNRNIQVLKNLNYPDFKHFNFIGYQNFKFILFSQSN